MKKDILPRFLLSSVFRRMVEHVAMWEPPPPASDLKVPPPGRRHKQELTYRHIHLD